MDILAGTNILLRRIHGSDPRYRQTRDALNRLAQDRHRVIVTSPPSRSGAGWWPSMASLARKLTVHGQ